MVSRYALVFVFALFGCDRKAPDAEPPTPTKAATTVSTAGRPAEPAPAPTGLRIETEPAEASSSVHRVVDGSGSRVDLPPGVGDHVRTSLSPQILSDRWIVFDGFGALDSYDVQEQRHETLFRFDESVDVLDYHWTSGDGTALAAVTRDPSADGKVELRLVDLGAATRAHDPIELDPKPLIRCASRCFVAEGRLDEERFTYRVSGGPDDPREDVEDRTASVSLAVARGEAPNIPAVDRTCESDADCMKVRRIPEGKFSCCRGCRSRAVSKTWEVSAKEACEAVDHRECPRYRCKPEPMSRPVCKEGECRLLIIDK